MSTGLRLIDFDYHFFNMDEADFEYPEHIGNLKNHPDLHKFIVDTKLDSQIKLYVLWKDGVIRLENITTKDYFDISLPIYIKSPELQHFIENYEVDKEGIIFTKGFMSADKYNKHLQFHYDEDKVYPEVCEKCGCLMGCSKNHWNKRNKTWQRLKCSDSLCGNVLATQQFIEELKPKNMDKLKEHIAHLMQTSFRFDAEIYMNEAAHEIYQNRTQHKNRPCQECGGELSAVFIMKCGEWYHFILACKDCHGSCCCGGFSLNANNL